MNGITSLVEAIDALTYGPKAVQLGEALRAGLPVPDGFALSHEIVEAVGTCDPDASRRLVADIEPRCPIGTFWAIRSSAVGEDSPLASFAGIHKSILGVGGADAIVTAVRDVHASALEVGAMAYRSHMGLDAPIRMAVIVQQLVDSDVGGVMFTRNPVTGVAERVIEASWGLGESVVSGLVTPDRYVLDVSGRLCERQLGEKDIAVRRMPWGGTCEEPVPSQLVDAPCLCATDLQGLDDLARRCDDAFDSTEHDIEFAIAAGRVRLLQRRPITSA
jgi:pyruvate,water dikinase